MKYVYYTIENIEQNEMDLCLVVEGKRKEPVYKIIAKIINVSQYSKDLIRDFVDLYIQVFEYYAEEDENGFISGPEMQECDIKDWMEEIESWRKELSKGQE